jgi:taurine dehydrogenase small subunit
MSIEDEESPRVSLELLAAINQAFNSRDADKIVEFFHDDAVFHMASGPDSDGRAVKGKEAIRKVLADRFEVIPDMRWEHIDEFIMGDKAVTVWRVKGNATDGTVLDYQGCDLFQFRDGLVQDKDTYWKIVQPE